MPLADPTAASSEASSLSPGGRYRAFKQAGLVLLCAAWILLGLFGHDPWKPDDATKATFAKYGVYYAAGMKAFFESVLY